MEKTELKKDFHYINCLEIYQKYEDFCITCNHTSKEKYDTFIINITQRYNLDKKENRILKKYSKILFKVGGKMGLLKKQENLAKIRKKQENIVIIRVFY